jgi:uncharacterized protein (TIGR02646 family)
MRPLRKGSAFQFTDGDPYDDAREGLAARIGRYCCYCERFLEHGIEVEHIQPKSNYPDLERIWANFLLACKNCNATKRDKDLKPSDCLIPDRDNTFLAFRYLEDGIVEASNSLTEPNKIRATETLSLVGLNKVVKPTLDEAGSIVPLDRRNQRLEAWLKAERYRSFRDQNKSPQLEQAIIDLAIQTGFFSMAAFEGEPVIRKRFLVAFPGTELDCFDAETTDSNLPHPNRDNLSDGGKT